MNVWYSSEERRGDRQARAFKTDGRTDERQIDTTRQQPVIGDKRKLIADLKDLDKRQDEKGVGRRKDAG